MEVGAGFLDAAEAALDGEAVVNVRVGLEPWTAPSGRREERWRRKRFRSRKLGVCERAELEKQARRRVAWQ